MRNKQITELFEPVKLECVNKAIKRTELLEQLSHTEKKLASVSRKLEEKNNIIHGLKTDLEHAIEQITLLQHKNHLPVGKSKWIAKPLPGING